MGFIHVLLVKGLCGDMTTQVAIVMAPLLPWIHTGLGNLGGK